ncbi:MAG: hypothetical protein WC123_03770 [Bacilli bacterium]
MNVLCEKMKFLRHISFILYHDLIKNDNISSVCRQYNKNQWKDKNELHAMQHVKLHTMLIHCMQNVPYYSRIFKDRNIHVHNLHQFSILKKLPFLDKDLIRKHFGQIQSENVPKWRIQGCSTSGSTGESLFFNADVISSVMHAASTFRNYSWCNVSPFERQATLWGARFDEPCNKKILDKVRAWGRPLLFLSSYQMTESMMNDYAELLCKYKPKILTSYPSPLERFAKFCMDSRVQIPSLRAIVCSAEQLTESQRYLFQDVFRVPVFNRYGSREFGNLACECEEHNGLHLSMERAVIEVVRDDGTDCSEGEVGEIVITDLDNKVMPFLRYRSGDMGCMGKSKCACGRGLALLKKIDGRVFDLIYTPSGGSISGTFWTLLLKYISKDILSFQIRQKKIEKIIIYLKMRRGIKLTSEQISRLRHKIDEVDPSLFFNIIYVDNISLTRSGKKRFVIGLGKFPASI